MTTGVQQELVKFQDNCKTF